MEQDLFFTEEAWQKEWQDMPEFIQVDLLPCHSIIINFETFGDMAAFSHLLQRAMTPATKSIWFPEAVSFSRVNKRYSSES